MDRRVLLADHHDHVLWALRTAVQEEPGVTVVGEASDAASLVSQARALRPDLILLEWELPGQPVVELLAILRALAPQPYLVALSLRSELAKITLASGADAFVSKAKGWEDLQIVLRSLAGQ